jgi:antitoxin CcdA
LIFRAFYACYGEFDAADLMARLHSQRNAHKLSTFSGGKNLQSNPFYDTKAPKKAVNVSINCDLLHKAKLNNINLSNALEERLVELLNEAQKKNWLNKDRDAIDEYNHQVDQEYK